MRAGVLLGLLLVTGCGSEPRSADAPSVVTVPQSKTTTATPANPALPPPTPPTNDAAEVEAVALRFYTAMFAGDTRTATELSITFEEMNALTKKPIEREEFDSAMHDFIRAKDANSEATEVLRVEVVERGVLRADENEKVTRDLEFAMVRPIVRKSGQEAPWMTRPFFKTEHGWKFSPKQ